MDLRKLLVVGLLCCLCSALEAQIKKSDLKVLYVGGTADIQTFAAKVDSVVLQKEIAKRTASFENMLKQYFETVTVVAGMDYTMDLSDDYDVTIFDGMIRELAPFKVERDAQGKVISLTPAVYLTEDFDRPAILLAEMGENLGRFLGLKTDWYCLCLDADAHHIRMDHPIFQGPFPVKMTMVMKPTPEAGKSMPYLNGEWAPDSLPMWRVQKEGYGTHRGVRIGMVNRPWGFEDSPEAEVISGGVSAKVLEAVAISRHGNFFHWGFAASPDGMTEEAKNVFANAIVYIAQFAGQTPIARKYDVGIITRDYTNTYAFMASRQRYDESLEVERQFAASMEAAKKTAQEKQAKGEELNMTEQIALTFQPMPSKPYDAYLQERYPDLYVLFGTDEKGYADYFADNAPYFMPDPRRFGFLIDEDARSLGIPTNDVRLLDKAISLWESGENEEKGRRLLERYTLCRFDTPAEWRAWFEANKSRLFFTESGGWYFLVNTRDKSVPGNDYSVLDTEKEDTQATKMSTLETDDRNPVRGTAYAESLPNGNRQIVLRVKIHPGYHIYARVADSDPFVATTVEFCLPEGVKAVGEMQRPSGKIYNSAGTVVYEGEIEFRQEVSGQGAVTCAINYQCCNDQICMPPTEQVLTAD